MKIQNSVVNLSSYSENISLNYEKLNVKIIKSDNDSKNSLKTDIVKLDVSSVNLEENILDENELKTFIVKFFIEKLTGKEIKIVSLKDLNKVFNPDVENPTQPQFAAEINYTKIQYEKEFVEFKGTGKVMTEDGKEINFNITFSINKEALEYTNLNLKFGSVALIDPLIINLNGDITEPLSDLKFEFDLNNDNKKEKISLLNDGFGFLVFDKNKNKKIDNGSELFGVKTGEGFKELKKYDDDNNNWIDENDVIFNRLNVWMKTEKQDRLYSLKELGIGAIYLENQPTPFNFDSKGNLAKSSIYLKENEDVGIISKINFAV